MKTATQHPDTADTVIDIRGLQKSFGKTKVLTDVNLKLFGQENLVVLGKSGTGKSVLIKCIVRLLESDSGEIKVYGKDVNTMKYKDLNEMRLKIGFLFQSAALYDSMSVRQNLEFPLRRIRKGIADKEVNDKIMEVLENVGLEDAVDKMPSELSGGMRKRIGLARTIVVDPGIILYDEPTTGLDPTTSDEISDLILEIQEKYKAASIIITHDIACARKVGNRFIMLREGVVFKEGSLDEFEHSDEPLIQSFFK